MTQLVFPWASYFSYGICLFSLISLFILSFDPKIKGYRPWRYHSELIPLTLAHAFVFTLGLLITICTESIFGGDWRYDWLEHYARSIHFCRLNTSSLPNLPHFSTGERTPFMNILLANDLDTYGHFFYHYQIYSLFYSSFFAISILFFFEKFKLNYLKILAFLIIQPIFIYNLIYPWPRLFCYALVILAAERIVFSKNKPLFLTSILSSLSILTHLTALVYVLPLFSLAYFKLLRSNTNFRKKLRDILTSVIAPILIFTPWFIYIYYTQTSLLSAGSNYFTDHISRLSYFQIIHNFYRNILPNIIPYSLLGGANILNQLTSSLYQIDFMFYMNKEDSILGGLGISGTLLFLYYLFHQSKLSHLKWWGLFSAIFCLGILIVPKYVSTGICHIALFPLVVISLFYLFSTINLNSKLIKLLFFIIVLIENVFIILLHVLLLSGSAGKPYIIVLSNYLSLPIGTLRESGNLALKNEFKLKFLFDFCSEPFLTYCLASIGLIFIGAIYIACFHRGPLKNSN